MDMGTATASRATTSAALELSPPVGVTGRRRQLVERPGRWWFSSKLMGAALPGAIRARDAATRCEPASPKGHRNQHVGLDPASAQPTTKLTDAAWIDDTHSRAGRGSDGKTAKGVRREPHSDAGENPAIGQPFNISWGGRGDESTELS